jgi:hypothetical protein
MKDSNRRLFSLIFFLFLLCIIAFEFSEYLTLADYMGQYVVEYDPEYFLYWISSLSIVSVIGNYIFIKILGKELMYGAIYLRILIFISLLFTLLILILGAWLFGDYKYDYIVFWAAIMSSLCNITMNIRRINR